MRWSCLASGRDSQATNYLLLQHKARSTSDSRARRRRLSPTRRRPLFRSGERDPLAARRAEFPGGVRNRAGLNYKNENEDLSIVACGPMVPEAMRAAYILKKNSATRPHSEYSHLKPIDAEAIIRAARETGVVVTAEEHQIGALAWRVSGILTESPQLYGSPFITGAIGVKDRSETRVPPGS